MPAFSQKSLEKLKTCDHHLQILFEEVIKYWDCSVIFGYRGQDEQNSAMAAGKSTKPFPSSKHNVTPSEAVDVAPCINGVVTWDEDTCRAFGGFVIGLATAMQIRIRWGGDWDGDHDFKDQKLNDLVHFETVPRDGK